MPATAVNAPNAQGSQAPGSPAPSVHVTAPSRPTTPSQLTLPQSPGSVSGPSSAMTSCVTLNSSATASSSNPGRDKAAAQRKEFRDALVDADGEISVLNEDDDSWTLIRSGPFAIKGSGENSWTDMFGGLTDKYLFLLKQETDPQGTTTRRSHAEKPIPLECLCLGSFDDQPQTRKQDSSFFKRTASCFSSLPTETLHPFTIYHASARMTRRYTLYAQSATERNKWRSALNSAVEARKAQQDLYRPKTLNGDFFKISPRVQFIRGVHYTGGAVCATEFSVQGEDYIAVGCTSGIYVSKRTADSFRKVLDSNEPKSMVAIPEFDKFLVQCDSALYSYPLDMIVLVAQGGATLGSIVDSEENLAGDRRDVLFFRAGRLANRTIIVYAAKDSNQSTLHVLELTGQQGTSFLYQTLGSPTTIQEEPHDAIFLSDKIAICTPNTIYVMDTTSPLKAWPLLSNSKRGANAFRRVLQGTHEKAKTLLRLRKIDKPKFLELVDKANVLGVVKYENSTLVIYDEFGCFIDEHGKPTGSPYYISWDCKATTYAIRGSHLLLFSPGFIEVRSLETGALVQVIKAALRSLRRGLTEQGMLIAVMNGGRESDGNREKLVELV